MYGCVGVCVCVCVYVCTYVRSYICVGIRKQILPDLRSSYVTGVLAQVEFCAGRKGVCMYCTKVYS